MWSQLVYNQIEYIFPEYFFRILSRIWEFYSGIIHKVEKLNYESTIAVY